ncbi:TPA: TniQ family protein [Vibrio parahaemolyticus]
MKTMLLQRPKPFEDESLESYLIRIANRNGYQDVDRFLSALKHYLCDGDSEKFSSFPTDIRRINPYSSKHSSAARSHALHQISQLTFTEPVDLLKLTINRSPLKYSPSVTALIRGCEAFPRSLLRTNIIPVCPVCLQENGYASYLWHFEGYDVCHKHHCALVTSCKCGKPYDYRKNGVTSICTSCGTQLKLQEKETPHEQIAIANWLAGNDLPPLPSVPKSYRWGLIHWWKHIEKTDNFNPSSFHRFWTDWPESFQQKIQKRIDYNYEYRTVSKKELNVRDIIGDLLFSSIQLPDRDFRHNIILRELFAYFEQVIWDKNGQFANLRLNSYDLAFLLNTDTDQIASLVEQRLLVPNHPIKTSEPFNKTANLFYLGDAFCLWLSEFQTDEFNRSYYVSRW